MTRNHVVKFKLTMMGWCKQVMQRGTGPNFDIHLLIPHVKKNTHLIILPIY